MGFEPLKPVGEPDAANSRIRFDVRVEALRPSFVAPFPRWRSSVGCECGQGRCPPLGELQDIVGEADEAPLVGDLLDAAQEKLTEAARLRIMKKYGSPHSVVTDGLCSYSAAMKEIGAADRHEVGGRLNNRAENSHQPFRRRERAMQRFRSMKTLQKFSSVHAQVHNHFNQERHLVTRTTRPSGRSSRAPAATR